jgi:N-methylhydantoinase A
MTQYQIGIDIGGTHTDAVILGDDGGHVVAKAPSTPDDFSRGVIDSLTVGAREMDISVTDLLQSTSLFVNGSTVATNVIAQLNGAKTGLITTGGFEDVMRIARSPRRDGVFDLHKQVAPPEIVPRTQVVGVAERIDATGSVVIPLKRAEAERAVGALLDEGVETIAVSLLWSFRNGDHETLLGEVIEELAPNIHYSLSSTVHPVIREYERTVTTVLNSYTAPQVVKYTSRLSDRLKELGLESSPMIMHSEGGYISMEDAGKRPSSLILSGPAAGAIGAEKLGSRMGLENIITADMGGTSYDTSVIYRGNIQKKSRALVSDLETGLSMVDVVAIGSGGGSIAWVDQRGLPSVGPQSAGAQPGPACYGKGGQEPTVTDALMVLGLLNPERFLAGRGEVSLDLASNAIQDRFAGPLGVDVESAAQWIYTLTVAQMGNATRSVSVERGLDPRDFCYFAFGGTAPLFASEICRSLHIGDIVVPGDSSGFCARGLIEADRSENYVESIYWTSEQPVEELNTVFRDLERRALEQMVAQGYRREELTISRSGDLRFQGQASELTVALPSGELGRGDGAQIERGFIETYETLYGKGTAWVGAPIEIQNARLTITAVSPTFATSGGTKSSANSPEVSRRRVYVPTKKRMEDIDVYEGESLSNGFKADGPALIELPYTVIFIAPDAQVSMDPEGNYRITQAN